MTDERLEKALEFANYRQTLFNQKKILQDNCEAQLSYAYNGGTFKIDQTLIAFINSFLAEGKEEMVVLDANKTPIKITDLKQFQDDVTSKYFEVTNEFHKQYEELQKSRKVEKLVD